MIVVEDVGQVSVVCTVEEWQAGSARLVVLSAGRRLAVGLVAYRNIGTYDYADISPAVLVVRPVWDRDRFAERWPAVVFTDGTDPKEA